MTATCNTCRWWDENRGGDSVFASLVMGRKCLNPTINTVRGLFIKNMNEPIFTVSDFGCIHHEPKDTDANGN